MSKRHVAMVCIEKSCVRFGVKHFNGPKMCISCGMEMFPEQDKITGYSDEPLFSEDMFERMGEEMQRQVKPTVIKHDDTFRCTPDVKGCPIATAAKVYIPLQMFNKWVFLANQLSTEWIAYLKGYEKENDPGKFVITDMYFPKQKGNATHCDAEDGEIQEGTIAAVHSHVSMNAFFSSEDVAHFNHAIELVVNSRGEIKAIGRTKLECGRYHRGDADIVFTGCEEELALEKALSEKLTEEKYTTFTTAKSKFDGQQTLLPS